VRQKFQLGIVGCGDIAEYTALFARLNPNIALAACCDIDADRLQRFARRFRIPHAIQSYEAMLNEQILDAVYLAIPHHLHATMLQQAIDCQIPALVEKPIARTLAEARSVVSRARERRVKVGVNYQYRYDSGCFTLARAVQQGALGRIYHARINLAWRRGADYFTQAAWHAHLQTSGGGTLITQGSHLLDLILWALGELPRHAYGSTARLKFSQVEVEDLAQAVLEMPSGALVQISSAMLSPREQPLQIEVYGERGIALYSDHPWPRVRFFGVRPSRARLPVGGVHALQRSLEAFRRWVQEDVPYLVPAEQALTALAAIEAVYRSAVTGCKELVDTEDLK
jgi:predicted dehydrogenase